MTVESPFPETIVSFVVYNVDTKHVLDTYDTQRGALIGVAAKRKSIKARAEKRISFYKMDRKQAERLRAEAILEASNLFVASREDFNSKIDEDVEVLVTIGGPPRKVKIRASEVGGSCDPSTERYWSM